MSTKVFDIEFVDHMGYYIPKSDVDDFDPETYFDGPILDENGLCEECSPYGYCIKENKIMNQEDYQALSDRCERALNEINNHNTARWLELCCELIEDVSIKTEGLPSVSNANFEGIHYTFISEFHSVYHQQLNNLNKSNT